MVSLLLVACSGGGGDVSTGTGGTTGTVSVSTAFGPVADSGQTSCYYDYTIDGIYNPSESACLAPGSGWSPDGQDGSYQINTMSFSDNGDGTVYDNISGLTWQKCSLGVSGADCTTGSSVALTFTQAKAQCGSLGLAGGGWRLPSVFELTRLVDFGKSYTAIDETVFPYTASSAYWTSTVHATQGTWAWYVNFSQGNTYVNNQSVSYYARCVRG